jgi:hypothetical protein
VGEALVAVLKAWVASHVALFKASVVAVKQAIAGAAVPAGGPDLGQFPVWGGDFSDHAATIAALAKQASTALWLTFTSATKRMRSRIEAPELGLIDAAEVAFPVCESCTLAWVALFLSVLFFTLMCGWVAASSPYCALLGAKLKARYPRPTGRVLVLVIFCTLGLFTLWVAVSWGVALGALPRASSAGYLMYHATLRRWGLVCLFVLWAALSLGFWWRCQQRLAMWPRSSRRQRTAHQLARLCLFSGVLGAMILVGTFIFQMDSACAALVVAQQEAL